MPAKSEKQRRLMAIAEHHPEKVKPENRGVLKMSKEQLSEFASSVVGKGKKKAEKHPWRRDWDHKA